MTNKLLILGLSLFLFTSIAGCSKDDDKDDLTDPALDFIINNSDNYAPANFTTTNTTTDYSGSYTWKIIKQNFTNVETFSTNEINYTADKIGTYEIRLIANNDSISKTLTINKPTYLLFDKVTLTNVSNNYGSLYFVVKRAEPGILTPTTVYTSPVRNNITNASVTTGNEYWNLPVLFDKVALVDGGTVNFSVYYFEFYDENDVLISRTDGLSDQYDIYSTYTDEETILSTASLCSGCDFLEMSLNTTFSNY